MEKIRKCIHCGLKPEVQEDEEGYFFIECCGNETHHYSLKLIYYDGIEKAHVYEWNNETNLEWTYIVGINYEIDENEQTYRDLDFMIEYNTLHEQDFKIIEFLRKFKNLFSEDHLYSFKNTRIKFDQIDKALKHRLSIQENLKRVCKFTSSFRCDREQLNLMIRYMDKEKLENATIRRHV